MSDRSGWIRWAVGTAVAVLAAAGLTGAYVAARYEAILGRMARETSVVKQRVERSEAVLREQLAAYRAVVELLRDPATRIVEMRGAGSGAGATGRVLWNETAGGQVFVSGLPPAPPGTTYELWTIAGAPRPAGVFKVDDNGRATHRVAPVPDGPVKAFTVTLEAEGGLPAPTGPVVLTSSSK